MSDTYLFGVNGGASHSFIAWIVFHLTTPNQKRPWESSHLADAHKFIYQYYRQYIVDGHVLPIADTIKQLNNSADNIPLLVFVPHTEANDFSKLEKRYPNFKYINIQVTSNDSKQLEINHFFKLYTRIPADYINDSAYWILYKEECNVNSNIRPGLTHLSQLTFEESIILIDKHIAHPSYYLATNSTVPNEFLDRSCTILFSDIVNNKDKVLETLSSFVNKNITAYVHEQYDIYIKAQIEFNERYYPK